MLEHACSHVCTELLSIYNFNKIIKTNVDVTYIIDLKFLVLRSVYMGDFCGDFSHSDACD